MIGHVQLTTYTTYNVNYAVLNGTITEKRKFCRHACVQHYNLFGLSLSIPSKNLVNDWLFEKIFIATAKRHYCCFSLFFFFFYFFLQYPHCTFGHLFSSFLVDFLFDSLGWVEMTEKLVGAPWSYSAVIDVFHVTFFFVVFLLRGSVAKLEICKVKTKCIRNRFEILFIGSLV